MTLTEHFGGFGDRECPPFATPAAPPPVVPRTFRAGDIVRLVADAKLDTPVGYPTPFHAGDQFVVRRTDGSGGVEVKSLDGYTYQAPATYFAFVRPAVVSAK